MRLTCALFVALFCFVHVDASAQQVLTLERYLEAVAANHPSLRAAQYEPDLAEAEIRNALGRFDPALQFDYVYKDKSGNDKLNYIDGSLELPLDMLFGPKISAGYRRGIGSDIDPQNQTATAGEASLDVSLPLFQGIFTDKRRNALRKALLRPEAAQAQFTIERNKLLLKAGEIYWDWAEAEAVYAIADSMYRLAEQRFRQVAQRVQAGQEAPIDSVEIAQEVQRRLGKKFSDQRKAEQMRVKLAGMIWANSQMNLTQETPEPFPNNLDSVAIVDTMISVALRSRPEINRIQVMQQMSRLDSSLAAEFMRPFVEAKAGIVSLDLANGNKLDYQLGLSVEQPLLFRSASAQMQTAQIGVQRADLSILLVLRSVEVDARAAVVAMDRSRDRVRAGATEVALAQQMVVAEKQKLDAGSSSLLQINFRERFLAEAQLRYVEAQADWARSLLNLRWATGQF